MNLDSRTLDDMTTMVASTLIALVVLYDEVKEPEDVLTKANAVVEAAFDAVAIRVMEAGQYD